MQTATKTQPLKIPEGVTAEQWDRMQEKFGYYAFRVYYLKTFAGENDNDVRFVKALLASARPIRDSSLVVQWYERQ